MTQPPITNFFNTRKRPAEGCLFAKSKVLILDAESKDSNSINSSNWAVESNEEKKRIVYQHGEEQHESSNKLLIKQTLQNESDVSKLSSTSTVKKLSGKRLIGKANSSAAGSDIRLAFKPKAINDVCVQPAKAVQSSDGNNDGTIGESTNNSQHSENRVVFELLSGLSPQKKLAKDKETNINHKIDQKDMVVKNARNELGLKTPKKEASLSEIRNKLARSSRLAEIRESINKFKKGDEQLKAVEVKRTELLKSPQLSKFKSIDLEVQVSPQKAAAFSPVQPSPVKSSAIRSVLASPSKAPAYQQFGHLVQPGVPALVLPYTYRMLAEIFSCMDTVTSMFYNRKETVTFRKLQAGVREMLRRNFTEQHLGQIKYVLPHAFEFKQEKYSVFGSSAKSKYELVVIPIIETDTADVTKITNGSSHSVMTPSILVERRNAFQKRLLDFVKHYHDKFLKSLVPPVFIERSRVTRWHLEFEIERVPVVKSAPLPQPPNEENFCSAKDVLDRAKTLFGCNPRLDKALLMVSEQMSKSEKPPVSPETGGGSQSNSSLLKGIPKALLEKIRAKQAAKALVAMTRTPDEDREAMQILRLPEIVRVLRNIFVAEKKNVLPLEVALTKLSNSYREGLPSEELEQHLRLLPKVIPGWLEILHFRKTDFVKISKDADMSRIMKKLEKLAAEKKSDI